MEIALVVLSILNLSFFIGLVSSVNKIKTISQGYSQLFISYNALREVVENNPLSNKDEQDIHKENFIKFLSDSREWAYEYIEEVQKGLKKFIEEVEPEINYYNKYGVVLENMITPHDTALKTISREFEELKKLLPKETDDRR